MSSSSLQAGSARRCSYLLAMIACRVMARFPFFFLLFFSSFFLTYFQFSSFSPVSFVACLFPLLRVCLHFDVL